MKKFGLLFLSLFAISFAFCQEDVENIEEENIDGSTLEQPIRPPVEFPWQQTEIGDFSDPVPYVHQRQADVMYYHTIWRTIDLREKINHPLYFPTEQRGTWRSLAQVIFDAIDLDNPENTKALPIYIDEFCNLPSTRDDIKGTLVQTKTIDQYDPETGEVIGSQDLEIKHEAKEVLSYNIKEIWFFDKERSVLEVRILELEPIIEYEKESQSSYVEENEEEDDEYVSAALTKLRLGYIYYDELRPYLAQQEVYNFKNNAQRISLDDLLTWKREFSSYIFAEQNVYSDRQIQDYIANSRDQRLESERITDKIRGYEHDLWEF